MIPPPDNINTTFPGQDRSGTAKLREEELALRVAEAGRIGMAQRILTLSTRSGSGLEALRACMEPRRTYCFVGSSGVGKSTLVNTLMGRDAQETRGVSGTGEGRHTTTRRELFRLPGQGLRQTRQGGPEIQKPLTGRPPLQKDKRYG